jgi:hypothetical protein
MVIHKKTFSNHNKTINLYYREKCELVKNKTIEKKALLFIPINDLATARVKKTQMVTD